MVRYGQRKSNFFKRIIDWRSVKNIASEKDNQVCEHNKGVGYKKQLIVSGDEMLSVIAKKAAMRHPPTPSPLEANWINRHVGPTLRQSESSM